MSARRTLALLALLLMASFAHGAFATQTPHAYLDRDHANLGDTVTLNIEGADASASPDLSPLANDFDVLGTSSSSSVQIVNGHAKATSQLGVALRPKHQGLLTIPPLRVGGAMTQVLTLNVAPAPSGAQGGPGDNAFLEASIALPSPYVGQQDVYTLRLFYGSGITGGQLEDPQADGAQLVHLNDDARYQTQRNGRSYQVVERHYALIPQHAGRIVVHGPNFMGQMLSSSGNDPFDSFFDNGTPVQASAEDLALDARAIPANAGTPWLPAQSVQLKLTGLPANAQAKSGEPLSVTLSVDALGVSADHLPEPQLPPIDGARVYPDKTRDATRDDGNWLHGTRTRTFAIVPERAGALTIPGITLNWWNVGTNQAQQTRVPAQTIAIDGAAVNGNVAAHPPATNSSASMPSMSNVAPQHHASDQTNETWRTIAVTSLMAWIIALTALAWWWAMRRHRRGSPVRANDEHAAAHESAKRLRQRTLDAARAGDVAGCECKLLEWARSERPDVHHLSDVGAQLSEPSQRAALEQLQRARWKGGGPREACNEVAEVFARGFVWNDVRVASNRVSDNGLPPLYPG